MAGTRALTTAGDGGARLGASAVAGARRHRLVGAGRRP